MRSRRFLGAAGAALAAGFTALLLAACATPGSGPSATPGSSAIPTTSPSATTSGTPRPSSYPSAPSPSPSIVVVTSRVTHTWGRPTTSSPFLTTHAITIPIAPPPAPALPCLRQIAVGGHPTGSPAYDQVSFRFTGGFPSYDVHYVRSLVSSGKGDVVPVPGATAILRVSFRNAQSHGTGCATDHVSARVGYPAIASYVRADDFEGYVDYGIGITANSGVMPRRVQVVEVVRVVGDVRQYVVAIQTDARSKQ